ncbi:TonB-dependent receptor [Sphingorhabdus sp.]|jgi:iron complex outermembrane receptor protein|uniref:TonB-dependent receptor n=1 Tax=Sphingorhabdus sp. TaxID=1902408 RepID=UPI003D813D80
MQTSQHLGMNALGVALTIVACASPAIAADELSDEAIVVTATIDSYSPRTAAATRTGTPALEAPFSFDTVGAALLADRGLVNLTDALRTVSGTNPVGGIGGFNTRFRLRGFVAQTNLRNGYRQGVAWPTSEVQNIERIEVLKGPSSMLYGRLEPGGVVNIVTKQPLDRDFVTTGIIADDDGLIRGIADINLNLGTKVAARINGVWENGESFRNNVANETRYIAPAIAFQPSERTRIVVEGEWLDRTGVFDRGMPAAPGLLGLTTGLPPERFLGDPVDRFNNSTRTITARMTHEFSDDVMLRVGGGWGRGESDGAYFFPVGGGVGAPLLTPGGILNRRNQITIDRQDDATAQADFIIKAHTGDVAHTVLLSIDWSQDTGTSLINRAVLNAPINIFTPTGGAIYSRTTARIVDSNTRNDGMGGLAQLESAWTPWLRTTAGVRVERSRGRFTDSITGITGQAKATAVTPRLGLTVLPGSGFALFANWGGSFNPETSTRPLVDRAIALPSRGEQFEVGTKWEALEGLLRASASAFQITKTNVRVAELAPSQSDRQTGEQRSQGIEIDLALQPVKGLTFEAAYTYTDAKVTVDRTLTGRRLNQVPDHSASFWARGDVTPRLGIGLGATIVGDRFIDPANSFRLASFARGDVAIFWRPINRLMIQANFLNVTNERYFENGNTINNFYPGQPRTLRASALVTF